MIELRKIDHDNFEGVLALKLPKEQQKFVAPNIYSLAEAYKDLTNNEKPPMPFAIYHGEELIGFTMMEFCELEEGDHFFDDFGDKNIYNFFRFMIDESHQGKGYGRQAMVKIMEFLKTQPQGKADSISVCYEPTNEVSRKLYTSLGFVETGHIDDGEVIARFVL
ncbi:MAG: GNAT family N-acetyltransferase [Defluviitaleaceae bacterium]|nr:GNAT family N-acetyltransferase [Defluviitaleaceae bacterium]